MLVLTRKISESFVVGDDVKITIIDIIGGNKVRVGIEAPQEVPVYREEIYEQIKAENQRAARTDPSRLPDM
jgi:carbon storage regulator